MCGSPDVFGVSVEALEGDLRVCLQVVVSFGVHYSCVLVNVVVFFVPIVRIENSTVVFRREGVLAINKCARYWYRVVFKPFLADDGF